MKTNKSFSKRIKVTGSGKLTSRKPGQNHFNAKERSNTKSGKKGTQVFNIKNITRRRFLPKS